MISALAFQVVDVFEISRTELPALLFFDDSDAPNCFQLEDPDPSKPAVAGTRGVVALGNTIVTRLLTHPELGAMRGAALAGIVAHEFAHAHQRLRGAYGRLYKDDPVGGVGPLRLVELHADLLAGFYVARRLGPGGGAIRKFGKALEELGDTRFSDPAHHGTPEERSRCMLHGRDLAASGHGVARASMEGEAFVSSL